MISNLRIGIPIIGNSAWLGGVYYIESIIKALSVLPANERPKVFLIVAEHNFNAIDLHKEILPLIDGILFVGRDAALAKSVLPQSFIHCRSEQELFSQIDFYYPVLGDVFGNACSASWIYDFQHVHLPEYFSAAEIQRRNNGFQRIAQHAKLVVFSSRDSENDFKKLYPYSKSVTRVLHFHTLIPDEWYAPDPQEVQKKYNLPDEFLLCSNQFYTHKNHMRLFEALSDLYKTGRGKPLVCTGPTMDPRTPDYFRKVEQKIQDLGIKDYVHILGVIPREEQLQLMRRALAVVQPSLFEGWSTVIEDARTLGKTMVLSDLAVNYEQAPKYAVYFDRHDASDLARKIASLLLDLKPGPDPVREQQALAEAKELVKQYAQQFCCIAVEAQSLFGRTVTGSVTCHETNAPAEDNEVLSVNPVADEIRRVSDLMDLHKLEDADRVLRESVGKYPNSPDLLNLLAILKVKMQDMEGARSVLSDIVKRWPNNLTAYNNLACIFWDSGDLENASKYFEDALRISQYDRAMVLSYGEMLFSYKKYAKSKEVCEGYLKLNPDDPEIHSLLKKSTDILEKVMKFKNIAGKKK